MTLQLSSNSRYKISQIITTPNGNETFGLMKKLPFLNEENIKGKIGEITIASDFRYRPDLLANKLYGDVNLYWVLIMFNKPTDIWRWPEINTIVRYPLKEVVLPYL